MLVFCFNSKLAKPHTCSKLAALLKSHKLLLIYVSAILYPSSLLIYCVCMLVFSVYDDKYILYYILPLR